MNCNTKTTRLNVLRPFAINALLLMIAAVPAAASDGYTGGYHDTGIDGTTVYLNDLEDHTWTYYSGVDASVDDGYYNTNYLGTIYSPDPRNVTIEYDANGGEVSISEAQNKFVYFKTLESEDHNGEYKYKVISNPFSKRPASGDASNEGGKTYYGFAGWKIISGGEYIRNHNDNDVLVLDEDIVFENLPYTSVNCMSATIKFQAQWTPATVQYLAAAGNQTISFTGGDYETNFVVMQVSSSGTLTTNSPCTIMMVEPDGSVDYRGSYTFSGTLSPNNDGTTKIEYSKWVSSKYVCANKHHLYLGRGLPSDTQCAKSITGINNSYTDPQFSVKVESGKYTSFYCYANTSYTVSGNMAKASIVIGCDYDRATGPDNNRLIFTGVVAGAPSVRFSSSSNAMNPNTLHLIVKSGQIGTDVFIEKAKSANDGLLFSRYDYCFYVGNHSADTYMGRRTVTIEGGEMCTFAGGATVMSGQSDTGFHSLIMRMKGGTIHGSIYGAASQGKVNGNIIFAITGGNTLGWIAPGCNGTSTSGGGQTYGKSYVYVGGNCSVNSHGSTQVIGSASVGGFVYGAGSGHPSSTSAGELTYGTNLVVADGAFVEKNVFAGGNYGYSAANSRIYVTGGEVNGGVYGGANQQNGKSIDIFMTGGKVNSGIYGGSNIKGIMDGNVSIKCLGGTVGTSSTTANIHGGGYGANTEVKGNISVSIGTASGDALSGNKDDIDNLKIYGDVYGGSALGKTNTGTATTRTTAVNMYSGTVYGNVYGGALGSVSGSAQIKATSQTVDIYGGRVTGGVYGGSNINANMTASPRPRQGVTIHDTWTPTTDGEYAIGSVFGGGNGATVANSGQPGAHDTHTEGTFVIVDKGSVGNVFGGGNAANVVKTEIAVNGCEASIGNIYGGCNAATVSGNTSTTIWGGTIENAFAGGNGVVGGAAANVGGNALLTIHGGDIGSAYAGSNNNGTITGSMTVSIDRTANGSGSMCDESVGAVYGGGNRAAGKAGSIVIDCSAENIGDVYGGANQADITTDILLNIGKGEISRVFGGNNTSGNIAGSITVNINKAEDCDNFSVGSVYGGGNEADYTAPAATPNYPKVSILAGTVTNDVFGGGLKATVTGNPSVSISGGSIGGDTYGGGSLAGVIGNTDVVMNGGSITGSIYGGGLGDNTDGSEVAADVSGTATVTVSGGTASSVFGCNNLYGAPETGATVNVTGGTVSGNVYGGGNLAAAAVSPVVTVSGGSMNRVFGGGLGESAVITGSPTVSISQTAESMTVGDVFGGGDAAAVNGDATVDLTAGTIANAFGGGNQAGVTGSTAVNQTGATVAAGIYGGCNTSGTVTQNTTVNLTGGSVAGNVHGGGYGKDTDVSGLSAVSLNGESAVVTNDIYGGSALGSVAGTNVTLTSGTVGGSVYGGGLGRKDDTDTPENEAVEAVVSGDVQVTMNGGSIGGDIFGCNNLNGAPEGKVQVDINATDPHQPEPLKYAVHAVYGGGNLAAYSGTPVVNINDCDVSIESVYGGGNAAATGGTDATIRGGIIGNAFGGGNGESGVAADVNGSSSLTINGGSIVNAFAGSNMHGTISDDMSLVIGSGDATCPLNVRNTYGGGNCAEGKGATITIGCGSGYLGNVYGGAKAAVINGGLVLNIEGGQIDNVFGGNDQSGEITGDITVNIRTGGCDEAWIKNVYGGGNMAPFSHNTTVNLISGRVGVVSGDATLLGGNVFGGGYGATATVTGSTTVNLCSDTTDPSTRFEVLGSIYGGGDLAAVSGDATVNLTKGTTAYAFGGGNKAVVNGTTVVSIDGATAGTVYGGGNEAGIGENALVKFKSGLVKTGIYGGCNTTGTVAGSTVLSLIGGTAGSGDATANIHGGGYGQATAVSGNVEVNLEGTVVNGDVYGGSALGSVNSGTEDYTHVTLSAGSVTGNIYGGGLGHKDDASTEDADEGIEAYVLGPVTVSVTGGTESGKIFGCNNLNGAPKSTVMVDINTDGSVTDVYGGGNEAAYTGNATVNLTKGTVSRAFGGGLGSTAVVTGSPVVNLTGCTAGDIFGGGDMADLIGNPQLNIRGGQATNIFGGGNEALVTGNPQVAVTGGTHGTVFGGGNRANVIGTPTVTVTGSDTRITGNVFGGGNQGDVTGSPMVTVGE